MVDDEEMVGDKEGSGDGMMAQSCFIREQNEVQGSDGGMQVFY